MNIQSISELTELSNDKSTYDVLLNDKNTSYLEISYPVNPNNSVNSSYISYRLNFSNFIRSIADKLNDLQTQINTLSATANTIKSTYVPLSGDVIINGPIMISPTDSESPSLIVKGTEIIRNLNNTAGGIDIRPVNITDSKPSSIRINNIDNTAKYVIVNGDDAQLHTSTDIDGCALSARWC